MNNLRLKLQIKPFNFYLVEFRTIEDNCKSVKSLAPYFSDLQSIVYEPFIDYEIEEVKECSYCYEQLNRTIVQYVNHPESKFGGETRVLERKQVHAGSIIHIEKEASNIDEQVLDVRKIQEFINKEKEMQRILTHLYLKQKNWEFQRLHCGICRKG